MDVSNKWSQGKCLRRLGVLFVLMTAISLTSSGCKSWTWRNPFASKTPQESMPGPEELPGNKDLTPPPEGYHSQDFTKNSPKESDNTQLVQQGMYRADSFPSENSLRTPEESKVASNSNAWNSGELPPVSYGTTQPIQQTGATLDQTVSNANYPQNSAQNYLNVPQTVSPDVYASSQNTSAGTYSNGTYSNGGNGMIPSYQLNNSSASGNALEQNMSAYAQNGTSQNGMTQNAMPQNGMMQNGMTQNAMPQNGMTQNGMSQNGMTQNGMTQNGMSPSSYSGSNPQMYNQQTNNQQTNYSQSSENYSANPSGFMPGSIGQNSQF